MGLSNHDFNFTSLVTLLAYKKNLCSKSKSSSNSLLLALLLFYVNRVSFSSFAVVNVDWIKSFDKETWKFKRTRLHWSELCCIILHGLDLNCIVLVCLFWIYLMSSNILLIFLLTYYCNFCNNFNHVLTWID